MNRRLLTKCVALFFLTVLGFYLSLAFGATESYNPVRVLSEIQSGEGVIYLFRLPRSIAALLVGVCFAISGTLLQTLTRNPLASPDLLGVTSGGGLATVVAILIGGSAVGPHLPWIAFLGASAVAALIWLLGWGESPQRFILTGVALSAFTQALVTLLLVTYAPSAAEAMIWLKGSLFGRGWVHVKHLLPWAAFSVLGGLVVAHQANPLALGPTVATTLGVELPTLRPTLWVLSVASAAAGVAIAGTIGFVGLVVPHLARRLCGPDLRILVPYSALMGGLFVLSADTLGRVIAPPLEIPAGLVCAFVGAPYFGYLLWKGNTRL